MKICERCGKSIDDSKEYCYCGCHKFVTFNNKTYHDKDKSYKKLDWYAYCANNLIVEHDTEDHINIKVRHATLLPGIQEYFINENITYSTKVCYTIPALIFYFIGIACVISFALLKINQNIKIMILFLGIFWLLLGILITYLHLFKHQKKIYMSSHGQKGYVTINMRDHVMLQIYFNELKRLQDLGVFFKPLYSERLGIREFRESDSADFMHITQEADFCTYLAMEPMGLEEAKAFINKHIAYYKEHKIYRLALINEQDKCIGFIGISTHNESAESCEIVYGLSNKYAHKGMMTEAVKLFTHFLSNFGKTRIVATHCVENIRSGHVLLKCGFVRDESYDEMMMIHGVNTLIIGYHYEA